MSTRCTIKHKRDETAGMGFHLYEDLAEDRHSVMLELEGFTFDTTLSYTSSGEFETLLLMRIPKRWAQAMGLITDAEETDSNSTSGGDSR